MWQQYVLMQTKHVLFFQRRQRQFMLGFKIHQELLQIMKTKMINQIVIEKFETKFKNLQRIQINIWIETIKNPKRQKKHLMILYNFIKYIVTIINITNMQPIVVFLILVVVFSLTMSCSAFRIYPPITPYNFSTSLQFRSGEVHYSRIPVEYWEHRIQTIKALGLNALSVYIMWNYHQVQKGKFDYSTENRNLDLFLNLAEKYNMTVLLRPGPYVCAQWDFGGLPARLYSIPGLVVRANNAPFLSEVRTYFQSLVPIIKAHHRTPQAPSNSIILLQIQNQYGSYGSDLSYIQALRQIWRDLNITCTEYHQDSASVLTKSHWTGGSIGLSGGVTEDQYKYARTLERTGMIFGGQIYTGWLTHWGEPNWANRSIADNVKQFQFLLIRNISFSMYMVHGGTNFGLTAGANQKFDQSDYYAHVTSYDYDSPINEQGAPTAKFYSLRNLIKSYTTEQIPDPPAPLPTITFPRIVLTAVSSILQNLPQPTLKQTSIFAFESNELQMFNQGIVIYQTLLTQRVYYLRCNVSDFGIVVLDGINIAVLDRSITKTHNFVANCTKKDGCVLRILVQAMGHINYDTLMANDLKGLFYFSDDKNSTFTWTSYKIPITNSIFVNGSYTAQNNLPTILKAQFTLSKADDTYIDTTELTKGYLFVNGRNLGRYWNKGPQKRLFCPGVWLKSGSNTIWVLQMLYDGTEKGVSGKATLMQ